MELITSDLKCEDLQKYIESTTTHITYKTIVIMRNMKYSKISMSDIVKANAVHNFVLEKLFLLQYDNEEYEHEYEFTTVNDWIDACISAKFSPKFSLNCINNGDVDSLLSTFGNNITYMSLQEYSNSLYTSNSLPIPYKCSMLSYSFDLLVDGLFVEGLQLFWLIIGRPMELFSISNAKNILFSHCKSYTVPDLLSSRYEVIHRLWGWKDYDISSDIIISKYN